MRQQEARQGRLFLLRHIFLREFRGKLRAHAGHRGSRAAAAKYCELCVIRHSVKYFSAHVRVVI
jgi:hypothetical protein